MGCRNVGLYHWLWTQVLFCSYIVVPDSINSAVSETTWLLHFASSREALAVAASFNISTITFIFFHLFFIFLFKIVWWSTVRLCWGGGVKDPPSPSCMMEWSFLPKFLYFLYWAQVVSAGSPLLWVYFLGKLSSSPLSSFVLGKADSQFDEMAGRFGGNFTLLPLRCVRCSCNCYAQLLQTVSRPSDSQPPAPGFCMPLAN